MHVHRNTVIQCVRQSGFACCYTIVADLPSGTQNAEFVFYTQHTHKSSTLNFKETKTKMFSELT